ncbi:MAG TPA: helix-turn-helix transcriptional regulator [Pseudobacteroides sp.]|uniref:helix-turn-helix domain-containing protein n=1 Tax=Pseudobacteroides sp. TaxID=1968840 RepID=UPI002F91F3B4
MGDIAKNVGNRIRVLRKERGWSQEDLALRADIHPSHMGTIERGEKSATIESFERIANALEITFDELFRFTDIPQESEDLFLLHRIINKLDRRSLRDLKAINTIIDALFPWMDEKKQ